MPRRSRGFPPIAAPDARVLILGSLPGQVSLARRQYYAQPHNAFWRIMGALCDAGPEWPYEERADRLRARGVALWDVCKAAVRPGSLDASIDLGSILPNDFRTFFRTHGAITTVFTNGGTATRLYARLVLPGLGEPARSLPLHPLPSTSPAHASLRFEQKLARWKAVAIALQESG
ncbi:MAG TPA: DNA-deoxyinosine glycosylase [Steroidobacteraceae bacterium]|nr:DNA-deoxyinosine glycosylase [Steroidobacteraceae bacterium]